MTEKLGRRERAEAQRTLDFLQTERRIKKSGRKERRKKTDKIRWITAFAGMTNNNQTERDESEGSHPPNQLNFHKR